ncbi:MAG: hypothetical protein UT24_C0033G0016 [Candidatus Woesebacteria bacterium GW2011_GWB1_39_12]|uniref:Uncharacterized protein n=1 Tax=Candidatus Woesebacteria bacterium GW2011_GWB1_39_12 TaxID=1618574 RepID=A0A0G0QAZ1_9BACT|nr:MAG: hypothetical protein UT24_C0033G0016 [Candidatus Woesebacteria bacterium GW2011_GWB1_39_12]
MAKNLLTEFTKLGDRLNYFNHADSTIYPKGSDQWYDYGGLLAGLPKDWKFIYFEIYPRKVEMQGLKTLPTLPYYCDLNADILVVDRELRLVRFCPKEMLKFLWQLRLIEATLGPRGKVITDQIGKLGRMTIYQARLLLDKFRPDSGFDDE